MHLGKEEKTDLRWAKAALLAIAVLAVIALAACDRRNYLPVKIRDLSGEKEYYLVIEESKTEFYDDDKVLLFSIEYSPPITDLENAITNYAFIDANNDGFADYKVPISAEGNKAYYFLYDAETDTYVYQAELSAFDSPVLENGNVEVTLDLGKSGTIQQTYGFDGQVLELDYSEVLNADEVIKNVVEEVLGADKVSSIKTLNSTDIRIQLVDGTNIIGDEECIIYSALRDEKKRSYFACSPTGKWYIDKKNEGKFELIPGYEGLAEAPSEQVDEEAPTE